MCNFPVRTGKNPHHPGGARREPDPRPAGGRDAQPRADTSNRMPFPPVSRVTSAGFACRFRRFRGGSGFIPYPVRPVNGVRVRDTVKVEESFCGPPWLSIMIGSVLAGPGASIQPTISGA